MMDKCPQCNNHLAQPNGSESYCEDCGYPDQNRAQFTLIEIKAYLRSMFAKQNCFDDVREENRRLAFAYNLLLDERSGIARFCDDGKADGLTFDSFRRVDV